MKHHSRAPLKSIVVVSATLITSVVCAGLFWNFFLDPVNGAGLDRLGWYFFAFVSGISMIVLPSTLPLALAIVPLSMGMKFGRGIGMALSFGLGISVTLSMYGVLAALVGNAGLSLAGAEVGDIKNWVYFIAGIFAYIFALSEIGLLNFKMHSYTEPAPNFIIKRNFFMSTFLLGMLMGNIGVGYPHPATPLLLTEVLSSGDVFYCWSLFFVHAIGRVLPLILLSVLAIFGINSLTWIVERKGTIEKISGGAMIMVAGFILTFGLFAHGWGMVSAPNSVGLFGQPAEWGIRFLLFLWVLPLWWHYLREKKRVLGTPALQIQKLQQKLERTEAERRGLESVLHLPKGEIEYRVRELEYQMDVLLKERVILEEAMRYGEKGGYRDVRSQRYEEDLLHMRFFLYLLIMIVLVFVMLSFGWLKI